jgi:peroxiredoxin
MARSDNVYELPSGLPEPKDDGACRHLTGRRIPSIALAATDGASVDLSKLHGWSVVYCYPRTGRPDRPPAPGWDAIPGARGCTPQTCGYRDHYQEIRELGVDEVFGLSTQDTAYQQELVERLHLPFRILSDRALELTHALKLPTFAVEGETLVKRLTLIVHEGVIEHVFYPVFPPDTSAPTVIHWLVERKAGHFL